MERERTTYTERTPWPGFATAILWAAVILSCYPILAGWDLDLPFSMRWPIALTIVVLAGAVTRLVGGLTVHVQETRILMHLGSVPLIKKTVAFTDITALGSVEYKPIREFGGWGVRGVGNRRAWTARGNHAVKLTLAGDRELLIGSDHPRRLEERIRTVAGERLGGTTPDDA